MEAAGAPRLDAERP